MFFNLWNQLRSYSSTTSAGGCTSCFFSFVHCNNWIFGSLIRIKVRLLLRRSYIWWIPRKEASFNQYYCYLIKHQAHYWYLFTSIWCNIAITTQYRRIMSSDTYDCYYILRIPTLSVCPKYEGNFGRQSSPKEHSAPIKWNLTTE